jgi:NDP-sugar pyrophosphorylase family protein
MKAMILAAGLGTRLRPLTEHTPKALLLVNGQPLIAYSLNLLKKHGITEVLINLHHLGDLIEKELGDGKKYGMKIAYSWERQVLGTGGGIKKGEPFFEGKTFLVLNSDILIDAPLQALVRFHKKKKGIATMVVRGREADSPYSAVELGRGDRILSIGAPPTGNSCLYTGVQALEPALLRFLPENAESCIIRQGYLPALAAGKKIFGYRYNGYWNDLGTLERYRQAEADLKTRDSERVLAGTDLFRPAKRRER